jgi:hypothetical protein
MKTSTEAGKVQASPQEPAAVGIGPRCPKCGCSAKLDSGDCVACSARAAAAKAGRSRADALLLAAGRKAERSIDQARHEGASR